ncbi:MAG: VanZ family protein [Nitrosomonadales bacterium]|nr:VanZ family protein [Nitrosomonadales bacterium]
MQAPIKESRAQLSIWLAIGYTLLIVYASLSPFAGWREQGLDFIEVLRAPFLLTYSAFDATVNLLAYIPLGLLFGLALRTHFSALGCVMLGMCLGVALSTGMEYLQMYLPTRVSSNMDLLTNSAGALTGSLLAVSITSWTWLFSHLMRWRSHLFRHGKEMDFGLALLTLWMFGQINPSLPMLGNVFISGASHRPFVTLPHAPFNIWESGAVALNLLMLGTLMLTLLRMPHNIITALLAILSLVALLKFIAAALLLKSWALLLWIKSEAVLGILLGILLLLAVLRLPRHAALAIGISTALCYMAIVNFVFDDNIPSSAMSIYHWHYGHLLNYNGLAQSITLVFPLLLILHLGRIWKV